MAASTDVKKKVSIKEPVEESKPKMMKKTGTVDRHSIARFVIALIVIAGGPVLGFQWQLIENQSNAMKWEGVPCYIHKSESRDASGDRRTLYKSNNEYKPVIFYTYLFRGQNMTSTQVYYYGRKHPGRPESQINRIIGFYKPGKKSLAFVDPEDPSFSILIQEISFSPYGWLLFEFVIIFATGWYFALEHDWKSCSDPPAKYEPTVRDLTLTDATPDEIEQWYLLPSHYGIRSTSSLLFGILMVFLWHISGHYTWKHYASHRTAPTGNELRFLFHILGGVLGIRAGYFIVFISRLQDLRLLVDKERIEMGSPFAIRVEQPRRSKWIPVEYEKVNMSFELIETFQGPRQGQGPNRQVKRLHSEKFDILQGYRLTKDSLGVSCVAPFDQHVCQLHSPPGINCRQRYYYRWVIDINLCIKWSPVSYHLPIYVTCFIPEELRPREEEQEAEEADKKTQ